MRSGSRFADARSSRKPEYGIYAWPYLASMIVLGLGGLVIIVFAAAANGYVLPTGILLTVVGFYLAVAHYSLIKLNERKGREFSNCMRNLLGPDDDVAILDLGCGTGRIALGLAKIFPGSNVIGIDIYSDRTILGNSPEKARENARAVGVDGRVSFAYGNAVDLPFRKESFDAVTAGSVLHLLAEAKRKLVMKEAIRVLKDGGKLLIIEIPRTVKIALIYWFPAFLVFRSEEYWNRLLRESGLERIETIRIGDLEIFCAQVQPKREDLQHEPQIGIGKTINK